MSEFWNEKKAEISHEGHREQVPVSPQSQLTGTRGIPFGSGLGKYRILDRVRTLHHAIVYKARDSMLDRLVVIKQMNPGLLDDPLACGDFRREAQLLARVPKDARNVIGIHELIGDEQGLFIVEEFTPGDWLDVLISKRQVGLADALRILKYAGLGLRALHSRKIVHRDMQPANLLLCPNGQVRIANFSSATHEGDHTPPPVMTSKYAAPELQLGMPHDDRVDIYSLGFTIYEVTVGRRALHSHFAASSRSWPTAADFWRAWHTDLSLMLPNATVLNPSVPPALAAILHRMTTKDVDERFATMDEVLQDIIRKFNNARANVAPAISGAAAPQLVDSGPRLLGTTSTAAPIDGRQPQSLLGLVKAENSTTTQSVSAGEHPRRLEPPRPVRKSTPAAARTVHRQPAAILSAPPRTDEVQRPATPRRVTSIKKVRVESAPKTIPSPDPVEEPPRRRRQWMIPVASALLLLASAWLGGNYFWTQVYRPTQQLALQSLLRDGRQALLDEDFAKAEAKFLEASVTATDAQKYPTEVRDAETHLGLIRAQKALARNQFDIVKAELDEAGKRGADTAALQLLRTRFEAKESALKLGSEGVAAAEAGRFVDAEMRVEPFEENARLAGLDPKTLKDKIQQEKDDRDYAAALERARKALGENDFESAMLACRDAQTIRVTTATRQLRQDIADAKTRYDWMIRGDKAMRERDFMAAESAYQSANAIDPNDDVEQKLRVASSMRLYTEARELIRSGDLIQAKNKLESALWKHPLNRQARAKLTGLATAFDAAQLVANADRELEAGNSAEAIRLYEKAIPDLIAPADDLAKTKLRRARQAASRPSDG